MSDSSTKDKDSAKQSAALSNLSDTTTSAGPEASDDPSASTAGSSAAATTGDAAKLGAAVSNLSLDDPAKSQQQQEAVAQKDKVAASEQSKPAKKVKIDPADVTFMVEELEVSKSKATEMLKGNEGKRDAALKAFIVGSQSELVPTNFEKLGMTATDVTITNTTAEDFIPKPYLRHVDLEGNYGGRYHYVKHLPLVGRRTDSVTWLYIDTATRQRVVIKDFNEYDFTVRNWLPVKFSRVRAGCGDPDATRLRFWPPHIPASMLVGGSEIIHDHQGQWDESPSPNHPYAGLKGNFPALQNYFVTESNGTNTCKWHLVLPHFSVGSIGELAMRLSSQGISAGDLDEVFRPSFERLLHSLERLHKRGFCHDDIDAGSILVKLKQSKSRSQIPDIRYQIVRDLLEEDHSVAGDPFATDVEFMLSNLNSVREKEHVYHTSKEWNANWKQWRSCEANDVRRALKAYLWFIVAASPTRDIFGGEEPWIGMYWRYFRAYSPQTNPRPSDFVDYAYMEDPANYARTILSHDTFPSSKIRSEEQDSVEPWAGTVPDRYAPARLWASVWYRKQASAIVQQWLISEELEIFRRNAWQRLWQWIIWNGWTAESLRYRHSK
ncbi:MAG: hypothetical protein M1831_004643 [Alyxoria varia]|nr:MAG: hypothetical protein M1831_004643 [Alyxoria varia]